MSYRVVYGETMPAWERTFPTKREAKAFAKVDVTDDDSLIDALITAARQLVETEQNRQLMPATYELTLDEFPSSSNCPIELPRPPLQSVSSITYVDTAGATQTWSSDDYQVDTKGIVGRRKFSSLVLHFFNHQTHHRGQATTLLFQAGQDVGVTDLLMLIPNEAAA